MPAYFKINFINGCYYQLIVTPKNANKLHHFKKLSGINWL